LGSSLRTRLVSLTSVLLCAKEGRCEIPSRGCSLELNHRACRSPIRTCPWMVFKLEQLLERPGAAMQPKPTVPASAKQKRLREYDAQRRPWSRILLAAQNRLAQLGCVQLRSLSRSLISKIKNQIATLDTSISDLIAQDQELRLKAQKLTSVIGVGARTAALVLAQLPELGQLNRRQTAALGGLAPFNRDSGTLRGKRAIFGGRRALRSGLYMAALSAARPNHILSPFYQRLRAKGKPHKLALTAVMRKLLIVLNQILKPIPSPA
jgi:transposase